MSRPEQKKLKELGIFRCFMNLLGVDWTGQFQQPDPPDPDVTVARYDGLLGIEITGIHDHSENQPTDEGEQRELLAKTMQLYEAAGDPPVTVAVNWNDSHKITKRERPRLAQALMRLVAHNLPSGSEPAQLNLREQVELPLLSLRVHRAPTNERGYWGASRAAFPRICDPAEVQRAIDKKAGKVSGYRAGCTEVWVLVVANHGDPSTWCTEPESLAVHEFTGPFERAYFMQVPGSLVGLNLPRGS